MENEKYYSIIIKGSFEQEMRFQTVVCILVCLICWVQCGESWFDYDMADQWGGDCDGQRQSPININSKDVDVCPMETFFRLHAPCEDFKLHPTGQALTVPAEDKSFISLMKVNIFEWCVKMWNYRSLQFHFHTPSEHTINHEYFDLEMHLVHEWFMPNETEMQSDQDDHFNFTQMMMGEHHYINRTHYLPEFQLYTGNESNSSNMTDEIGFQQYAVLGLLFKVDYHVEEDVFDTFIKYMNEDHGIMDYNYTFSDVMLYMMNGTNNTNTTIGNDTNYTDYNYTDDMWANLRESFECVGQRYFYHYLGSLTTPPCTESVQWFVMRDPLPIRPDKLEFFQRELNHGHPNNRPVQDYNDRHVSLVSQWECVDYKMYKIWEEFGDYDQFFDEMEEMAMNSTFNQSSNWTLF